MKCVKNLTDGVITRMKDETAHSLVTKNPSKFTYAPKNEWKKQAKDVKGRRRFYAKHKSEN